MPLSEPRFENSMMLVEAVGHIERADVEIFHFQAQDHYDRHGATCIVVIDASRVEFITSGARVAFADTAHSPAINALIFIAVDSVTMQTVRTIQMLSEHGKVEVFASIGEAREHLAGASF
ncbi:MAG: hypothetical protein U0670_03575 [Anaerolineae bacterium]